MTYDGCYVALIHHHHVLFGKKILSAVVRFVCFHTESPKKVRIGIGIANKFKQHHLFFRPHSVHLESVITLIL